MTENNIKKFIRVRCPLCGMLPTLEYLEEKGDKEIAFEVLLVKMGGKKPSGEYIKVEKGKSRYFLEKTKGKRKKQPPGILVYVPFEDKETISYIKKLLKNRIKILKKFK